MDFGLTEDQKALQEGVEKVLAQICPLSRIRRQAAQPQEFPEDIWAALAEAGIFSTLIAEKHGGLGLGMLDAALIAEKIGRFCVPAPFLGVSVLAPLALMWGGSEAQKAALLPEIAAGRLRIGVAVSEFAAGARRDMGLASQGGKLSGKAAFAIDSLAAHRFLVGDRSGDLHLIASDQAGLEVVALDTVDRSRSVALLEMENVAAERLDFGNGLQQRRIIDAARVMLAADMLGAAWHMFEQAVEYAKMRQQFGRPIGSFQAIKHICADMAAELEPGRAMLWYAAYALDQNQEDASLCAAHAKATIGEAARFVARKATEIHGGMGITDELGLHFWFKRIGWGYQALGGPERLREEAALMQGLMAREAFVIGAAPAFM